MYSPSPPLLSRSLKSYQTVATQTASPGQLVLMLYDGAIRFLERALEGFQFEDPLEFNRTINNNVLRAQEILNELNSSLDLDRGGKLAATLRGLYLYMHRQLMLSNVRKSQDGIRDTLHRLAVLREAWSQALTRTETRAEPAEPLQTLAAAC